MPGDNRILPFAEQASVGQKGGVMPQDEYTNNTQRLYGQQGIASSQLNNKALKQSSYIAAGIGRFIANNTAYDVDDTYAEGYFDTSLIEAIRATVGVTGKNMWTANTAIVAGDIRYTVDGNGPSWAYLQCSISGTTGTTEPTIPSSASIGQTITDNSVTWIVQKIGNALTLGGVEANKYALLESPNFTGTATAPTPAAGTNTTQIATAAFVMNALLTKANINSPKFTGTPEVPTATKGTNTDQAASTAFVQQALSNLGIGIIEGNWGSPGYAKFSNGFIIQWGIYSNSGRERVIYFPVPMSNVYYADVRSPDNCETFVYSLNTSAIYYRLCNGYNDDVWSGTNTSRLFAIGLV